MSTTETIIDRLWAKRWKELAESATSGQPGSPSHEAAMVVMRCRVARMQAVSTVASAFAVLVAVGALVVSIAM